MTYKDDSIETLFNVVLSTNLRWSLVTVLSIAMDQAITWSLASSFLSVSSSTIVHTNKLQL